MPGATASSQTASASSWQLRPSMLTLPSRCTSAPPSTDRLGSETVAKPPGTTLSRIVSLRLSCGPASTSSATACHACRVAIQVVTDTSMADYDAVMISDDQDQGFDP